MFRAGKDLEGPFTQIGTEPGWVHWVSWMMVGSGRGGSSAGTWPQTTALPKALWLLRWEGFVLGKWSLSRCVRRAGSKECGSGWCPCNRRVHGMAPGGSHVTGVWTDRARLISLEASVLLFIIVCASMSPGKDTFSALLLEAQHHLMQCCKTEAVLNI